MLSFIKESFKLTNKYIILATPLIFFSLISSLYILFSLGGNMMGLLVAVALFILMLTAFLSGWGYMIKLCVSEDEREEVNSLIKEFPAGVGEYFLPVLGTVLMIFIVSSVILAITYFAGMKLIGNIGIPATAFSGVFESSAALKSFLNSLTDEQLFKLNAWNLILFAGMVIEYFAILFYLPALFFKTKNPFKAFFVSLKDLFSRKFLSNVWLYILISVVYFIISLFTTLLGGNVITHFIFTLINFYYMVFAAVLIANYYYKNFVKIGGNLDKTV